MSKIFTPVYLTGMVVHGFGRGSKELGIPTANLDKEAVLSSVQLPTGVYYGFASVSNGIVYKAVTSVGWNPQYDNEEKSVEVHILNTFDKDFYGEKLKFIFLGYIRNEWKFESVDALVERIHLDIEEGKAELDKLENYRNDDFFR